MDEDELDAADRLSALGWAAGRAWARDAGAEDRRRVARVLLAGRLPDGEEWHDWPVTEGFVGGALAEMGERGHAEAVLPNGSRIGAAYPVGGRVFEPNTPRGVLADALQEAGREWEAVLLRSAAPVALDDPVRPPGAADVAAEFTRLLPWMFEVFPGASCWGISAPGYDMVALVGERGNAMTAPNCWWFRWPARDTGAAYAALRVLGQTDDVFVAQVVSVFRALGIPVEHTPLI